MALIIAAETIQGLLIIASLALLHLAFSSLTGIGFPESFAKKLQLIDQIGMIIVTAFLAASYVKKVWAISFGEKK